MGSPGTQDNGNQSESSHGLLPICLKTDKKTRTPLTIATDIKGCMDTGSAPATISLRMARTYCTVSSFVTLRSTLKNASAYAGPSCIQNKVNSQVTAHWGSLSRISKRLHLILFKVTSRAIAGIGWFSDQGIGFDLTSGTSTVKQLKGVLGCAAPLGEDLAVFLNFSCHTDGSTAGHGPL